MMPKLTQIPMRKNQMAGREKAACDFINQSSDAFSVYGWNSHVALIKLYMAMIRCIGVAMADERFGTKNKPPRALGSSTRKAHQHLIMLDLWPIVPVCIHLMQKFLHLQCSINLFQIKKNHGKN